MAQVTERRVALLDSELSIHRGLAVARWMSFAWSAVLVASGWDDMRRRPLSIGVLIALGLVAASATAATRRSVNAVTWLHPLVAVFALAADGAAFKAGHVGSGQNIAASFPVLAAVATGVVYGRWIGLAAAAMVTGRVLGTWFNGAPLATGTAVGSFAATTIFLGIAGFVAGYIASRLRRVEVEVARRKARDDVARTLHDTVLQTLAVVQRRTSATDPELSELARTTDEELRAWLRMERAAEPESLTAAVHAAARLPNGGPTVTVNVVADPDDEARVPRHVVTALAGAIGEAVRNADRHASARTVVVFVDLDDVIDASVRDDGVGFDPVETPPERGLATSVIGRINDVGGTVDVRSAPGSGTTIGMRVPWRR